MASSLLDELPCLLDEADELMARLAFFLTLMPGSVGMTQWPKSTSENPTRAPPVESGDSDELAQIRACLASVETETALKFFAKQFLVSQPVAVEKVLALLSFQDRSSSEAIDGNSKPLQSVAKKVFHLMKRVHHWQRAAWGIMTQFFAESAYLSFDKHRLLSSLLLDTLTKYVKVHLLWTSWRHAIPSLLALHTFVQFTSSSSYRAAAARVTQAGGASGSTSGPIDPSANASATIFFSPLEHTDLHLREYVLCFGSNPLFKIQQDFQQHPDAGEITRNLTSLTLSCFESYISCHDLEQLRNQGVFDTETFFLGHYAALRVYEDLLVSRQQEDWVLCTALCLPHQLRATPANASSMSNTGAGSSSVQLWDFVHIVAQDRLLLPVFRDFALNVHSALYQQIALNPTAGGARTGPASSLSLSPSSPPSSTGSQSSSLKQLVRALSKQALRTCASYHLQRSQLVSWLAQSCHHVLTQHPALTAPLFPVLLSTCRLARDEIEWLLSHAYRPQELLLPTHVKPKHLHRIRALFTGCASVVGELLARVHRLRSLVQQNLHFVEGYYAEFVAHGDADAIAFEIRELLTDREAHTELESSGGGADEPGSSGDRRARQAQSQLILSSFAETERYCTSPAAMTWRREWRQLSVVALATPSIALPARLTTLMERACVHTTYLESAGRLVSHHSQLSKWWWCLSGFEETFQQLLHRGRCGATDALTMLEIVYAAATGSCALDEISDELEVHDVALAMHALYDRMEAAVGVQLEQAVEAVVVQEVALHYRDAAVESSCRHQPPISVDRSVHLESRRVSASSKSSEHRLPSAIVSRSMRNTERATNGGPTPTPHVSPSLSLSLERIAESSEALTALTTAICASVAGSGASLKARLAALVETHVRCCLVRFLRGLISECSFESGTSDFDISENLDASGTGATAAPAALLSLRCSLEEARFELQSYVRCIRRLFRNADFVDPGPVVLDTLASERRVVVGDSDLLHHDSNLMQRVVRLYLSVLKRQRVASTSALVASRRAQGFVTYDQVGFVGTSRQQQQQRHLRRCATLDALRCLRDIIGAAGMCALAASVIHCVCRQVHALRAALEYDEVALIWFGKAAYSGSRPDELAMAIKQMARLEEIAGRLTQIGVYLFFVELLEAIEPAVSSSRDLQKVALANEPSDKRSDPELAAAWNRVRELGGSTSVSSTPRGGRAWTLLPSAFAASFYSSLWRRSKYLDALDAADSNTHMSALATLCLLQLVREEQAKAPAVPETSAADGEPSTDADAIAGAVQPRALLQDAVFLGTQVALGLRAAATGTGAKDAPATRAMFAAVRVLSVGAAAASVPSSPEAEIKDGVVDEPLPDIVLQLQ